jgi:hypothetical protein
MTVPLLDAHTSALVAAVASGTSKLIGDGVRPDGAGWQDNTPSTGVFKAYAIAYPLPTQFDGPLGDTNADVDGVWQFTSVGPTRHVAQDVADSIRTWLLAYGRTLSIPDRTVIHVGWDGGGEVRRDDTDNPPLFYGVDRYLIRTTPT